jgi:hypothetical protein
MRQSGFAGIRGSSLSGGVGSASERAEIFASWRLTVDIGAAVQNGAW